MKDCRGKTIKVGDTLKVSSKFFDCLKKGETRKLRFSDREQDFYIKCRNGTHFLNIQMDSKGKLIGLEKTQCKVSS
jgi:hypothetical protein